MGLLVNQSAATKLLRGNQITAWKPTEAMAAEKKQVFFSREKFKIAIQQLILELRDRHQSIWLLPTNRFDYYLDVNYMFSKYKITTFNNYTDLTNSFNKPEDSDQTGVT